MSLEPDVFDGNPINYCSFIDSFDALVAYNVPEPKRKLYYLLQYTKGPARDLVKNCQYFPGPEGYIKARNLKNTFGQKFQIAKANINSVVNGSVLDIKDKLSLMAFSAKLNACMNVLEGINYLNRMDNLDILHKIAKRLPPSWITRWQCEADHVIHAKLREVSIKHLASYVSLRTRQQTNFAGDWN